jgi:hypothetical protein
MSRLSVSTCSRLKVSLTRAAHDRDLLGVGWQRVCRDDPAAFGRQLQGDIELVEVAVVSQLEGNQWRLLFIGADQKEAARILQLFCEHSRVLEK